MGSLFETQETSFKNIMEKPLIKLDHRIVFQKKKKKKSYNPSMQILYFVLTYSKMNFRLARTTKGCGSQEKLLFSWNNHSRFIGLGITCIIPCL